MKRSTAPKIERRLFSGAQLRAMMADDRATGASGYAAVFNEEVDLYWFREKIAPGAFTRALTEKQDVRALENHDPNRVLGRTKAGTLKLVQDERGLKFDCDFPDTQVAKDLLENLRVGNVDQCSFAFSVVKQTWTEQKTEDGSIDELRIIEDLDLYDVSIVTYPAYEGTSTQARSASLWPNGAPSEIRSRIQKRNTDCACSCDQCQDGDCENCSNSECADENCRCMRSKKPEPPVEPPVPEVDDALDHMKMRQRLLQMSL